MRFLGIRLGEGARGDDPGQPSNLPQPTYAPPPGYDEPYTATDSWDGLPVVAQVIGPTRVPQITVGQPSPSVEPSPIAIGVRSFPFRPDSVIDGWSTNSMALRGASQRGHLHRYNGAPRQDDFAMHLLPGGRVLILVADGVSGARHSHIGASAAIRYAAEWLRCNLADDIATTDWLALLKSTAWDLSERAATLLELPEPDAVRTEEELATTLLCAILDPISPGALRAYLIGVGDSSAWVLSSGQFAQVFGGKVASQGGIASSAVVALPRVPTEVAPVIVEVDHREVLLIGTDGIGDPLGSGQGGVGNLFRDVFGQPSPPSLIEFAHAVDFSRETFDDDRTLVAVWPQIPGPRHAAAESAGPPPGVLP